MRPARLQKSNKSTKQLLRELRDKRELMRKTRISIQSSRDLSSSKGRSVSMSRSGESNDKTAESTTTNTTTSASAPAPMKARSREEVMSSFQAMRQRLISDHENDGTKKAPINDNADGDANATTVDGDAKSTTEEIKETPAASSAIPVSGSTIVQEVKHSVVVTTEEVIEENNAYCSQRTVSSTESMSFESQTSFDHQNNRTTTSKITTTTQMTITNVEKSHSWSYHHPQQQQPQQQQQQQQQQPRRQAPSVIPRSQSSPRQRPPEPAIQQMGIVTVQPSILNSQQPNNHYHTTPSSSSSWRAPPKASAVQIMGMVTMTPFILNDRQNSNASFEDSDAGDSDNNLREPMMAPSVSASNSEEDGSSMPHTESRQSLSSNGSSSSSSKSDVEEEGEETDATPSRGSFSRGSFSFKQWRRGSNQFFCQSFPAPNSPPSFRCATDFELGEDDDEGDIVIIASAGSMCSSAARGNRIPFNTSAVNAWKNSRKIPIVSGSRQSLSSSKKSCSSKEDENNSDSQDYHPAESSSNCMDTRQSRSAEEEPSSSTHYHDTGSMTDETRNDDGAHNNDRAEDDCRDNDDDDADTRTEQNKLMMPSIALLSSEDETINSSDEKSPYRKNDPKEVVIVDFAAPTIDFVSARKAQHEEFENSDVQRQQERQQQQSNYYESLQGAGSNEYTTLAIKNSGHQGFDDIMQRAAETSSGIIPFAGDNDFYDDDYSGMLFKGVGCMGPNGVMTIPMAESDIYSCDDHLDNIEEADEEEEKDGDDIDGAATADDNDNETTDDSCLSKVTGPVPAAFGSSVNHATKDGKTIENFDEVVVVDGQSFLSPDEDEFARAPTYSIDDDGMILPAQLQFCNAMADAVVGSRDENSDCSTDRYVNYQVSFERDIAEEFANAFVSFNSNRNKIGTPNDEEADDDVSENSGHEFRTCADSRSYHLASTSSDSENDADDEKEEDYFNGGEVVTSKSVNFQKKSSSGLLLPRRTRSFPLNIPIHFSKPSISRDDLVSVYHLAQQSQDASALPVVPTNESFTCQLPLRSQDSQSSNLKEKKVRTSEVLPKRETEVRAGPKAARSASEDENSNPKTRPLPILVTNDAAAAPGDQDGTETHSHDLATPQHSNRSFSQHLKNDGPKCHTQAPPNMVPERAFSVSSLVQKFSGSKATNGEASAKKSETRSNVSDCRMTSETQTNSLDGGNEEDAGMLRTDSDNRTGLQDLISPLTSHELPELVDSLETGMASAISAAHDETGEIDSESYTDSATDPEDGSLSDNEPSVRPLKGSRGGSMRSPEEVSLKVEHVLHTILSSPATVEVETELENTNRFGASTPCSSSKGSSLEEVTSNADHILRALFDYSSAEEAEDDEGADTRPRGNGVSDSIVIAEKAIFLASPKVKSMKRSAKNVSSSVDRVLYDLFEVHSESSHSHSCSETGDGEGEGEFLDKMTNNFFDLFNVSSSTTNTIDEEELALDESNSDIRLENSTTETCGTDDGSDRDDATLNPFDFGSLHVKNNFTPRLRPAAARNEVDVANETEMKAAGTQSGTETYTSQVHDKSEQDVDRHGNDKRMSSAMLVPYTQQGPTAGTRFPRYPLYYPLYPTVEFCFTNQHCLTLVQLEANINNASIMSSLLDAAQMYGGTLPPFPGSLKLLPGTARLEFPREPRLISNQPRGDNATALLPRVEDFKASAELLCIDTKIDLLANANSPSNECGRSGSPRSTEGNTPTPSSVASRNPDWSFLDLEKSIDADFDTFMIDMLSPKSSGTEDDYKSPSEVAVLEKLLSSEYCEKIAEETVHLDLQPSGSSLDYDCVSNSSHGSSAGGHLKEAALLSDNESEIVNEFSLDEQAPAKEAMDFIDGMTLGLAGLLGEEEISRLDDPQVHLPELFSREHFGTLSEMVQEVHLMKAIQVEQAKLFVRDYDDVRLSLSSSEDSADRAEREEKESMQQILVEQSLQLKKQQSDLDALKKELEDEIESINLGLNDMKHKLEGSADEELPGWREKFEKVLETEANEASCDSFAESDSEEQGVEIQWEDLIQFGILSDTLTYDAKDKPSCTEDDGSDCDGLDSELEELSDLEEELRQELESVEDQLTSSFSQSRSLSFQTSIIEETGKNDVEVLVGVDSWSSQRFIGNELQSCLKGSDESPVKDRKVTFSSTMEEFHYIPSEIDEDDGIFASTSKLITELEELPLVFNDMFKDLSSVFGWTPRTGTPKTADGD